MRRLTVYSVGRPPLAAVLLTRSKGAWSACAASPLVPSGIITARADDPAEAVAKLGAWRVGGDLEAFFSTMAVERPEDPEAWAANRGFNVWVLPSRFLGVRHV